MPAGTDAIISHLEDKEKKEGQLPPLLKFYQRLLIIQSRVERKLASLLRPGLGSEAIRERIEHGTPLIRFDEFAFDLSLLQATFTEVAALFAEYPELFGEVPEKLKEPGAGRLLTRETLEAWFTGDKLPHDILPDDTRDNLVRAVIHAALKPFLVSHARTLAGSLDQERWRRTYCPICGGRPDLGFLDAEHGARWLVCSRCDTEWLFQRMQCPCCGTQDQNALSYFTDEKNLYRLYVCDRCKQYLKAIDLRQARSAVFLPLERLYTIDLDSQAAERGYSPCSQAPAAEG